ncbi:TetR/AcrR family transcriptional regulator [Mycobacterium sp. pW049]|uniref:TetR/AcrR family transcriptional regulator n=1 Tax=[Mycobacterium] bulgaricum TaxID=3238985 RepID=UPI00351BB996
MAQNDASHRLGPYRDPQVDTQVLDAVRELLVDRGYQRISMDAIAEKAGVSRPTIYRRWPSKAHVVYDAVYPDTAPHVEAAAADAFSEIRGAIRGIFEVMGEGYAREALPGLMADMRTDATLQPKLAERHNIMIRTGIEGLIRRNAESMRQVDAAALLDLIVGAAISALCIRDIDEVDGFVEAVTDILLHGVLKHAEADSD